MMSADMSDDTNSPPKPHLTAQQKQERTDEAFKSIQDAEKRASDAKSARLREARLKRDAEVKAAPPTKKRLRATKAN